MVPQKKSLVASERDEQARAVFRSKQSELDPTRLVIIDESGSNLALSLLYGWGPTNQRVYGKVPRNWGKNLTIIAALTLSGILLDTVIYFEGATDQLIFEEWVAQVLVPHLVTGQIVILDNLAAHTGTKVRELIEGAGCELLYLPAYSPDFSPIELAFAKVKAILRRLSCRGREALVAGWEQALEAISAFDAAGFFAHCGYPVAMGQ